MTAGALASFETIGTLVFGSPIITGIFILTFFAVLTMWRRNFLLFLITVSPVTVLLCEAGMLPLIFKALVYIGLGLAWAFGLLRVFKG